VKYASHKEHVCQKLTLMKHLALGPGCKIIKRESGGTVFGLKVTQHVGLYYAIFIAQVTQHYQFNVT
jgi:hypothetical protein